MLGCCCVNESMAEIASTGKGIDLKVECNQMFLLHFSAWCQSSKHAIEITYSY
jgi:hypothetical protein